MTPAQELPELQRRYAEAMAERKWKTATLIWHRMHELRLRQLRKENRTARKRAA